MRMEQCRPSRVERTDLYPVIAAGCLFLAAAVSWSSVLLVVLGHVIPSWAVSTTLLLVSMVFVRVVAVRQRSTAGLTASHRLTPPRFVRGLLAAAAGLGIVFGVMDDFASEYHVLHPTGPHGCTAVVRETSFLLAGRGEVYAVGPTGIAWRPSGSWLADDGYRPIAEGTYELRWSQDGGTLTVRGTEVNPVMQGLQSVDCN